MFPQWDLSSGFYVRHFVVSVKRVQLLNPDLNSPEGTGKSEQSRQTVDVCALGSTCQVTLYSYLIHL